jgi:hypothetical protein
MSAPSLTTGVGNDMVGRVRVDTSDPVRVPASHDGRTDEEKGAGAMTPELTEVSGK